MHDPFQLVVRTWFGIWFALEILGILIWCRCQTGKRYGCWCRTKVCFS